MFRRADRALVMIREARLSEVDFGAMRAAMVASQLRTSDVNDSAVIAAMASVPRENYVPAPRRSTAYVDRPIALENGEVMNPPLVTGRLLTLAQVRPGDKVLLLGDTTGYTAAILAEIGAQVTMVSESTKPSNLPASIQWSKGNPAKGSAKGAPYDIIIIDGAVQEFPATLASQLIDGGKVVLGLVERGVTRLCSGRKALETVGFVRHYDMDMAVLPGFESKSAAFVF